MRKCRKESPAHRCRSATLRRISRTKPVRMVQQHKLHTPHRHIITILCSSDSKHNQPVQRNAANARERARMRVLSSAFCRLKTKLPWVPADTKLSKLDTLRLATIYIQQLRASVTTTATATSGGDACTGAANQAHSERTANAPNVTSMVSCEMWRSNE